MPPRPPGPDVSDLLGAAATATKGTRRAAAGTDCPTDSPPLPAWFLPAVLFGGCAALALAMATILILNDLLRGRLAGPPLVPDAVPEVDRPSTPPRKPAIAQTTPPERDSANGQRAADAARSAERHAEDATVAMEPVAALIKDLAERVASLESTADQALQELDTGRSPRLVVSRARMQEDEIKKLLGDVTARCGVVETATAAAKADAAGATDRLHDSEQSRDEAAGNLTAAESAPSRNEQVVDSLRKEQALMAGVVAAVKADAARAEAAAARAADVANNAAVVGSRVQELETRLTQARERLAGVERRLAAATAAFSELKKRINAAAHHPEVGIDARIAGKQSGAVCTVGDAVIAPQLPDELVPAGGLRLRCTAGEAANTWNLVAVVDGHAEPLMLGTAAISADKKLVVSVVERDDRNAAARDALTTSVLRLHTPIDADVTTYVQLCRPVECGPLALDRFFSGRAQDTRRDYPFYADGYPCDVVLPASPWSTTLQITGRCGEVVGEPVLDAPGRPRRAAAESVQTLCWSWRDEPFLETDMQLETDPGKPAGLTVQIAAARLLAPWDGPRRLGLLWDSDTAGDAKRRFSGLPTNKEIDAQTHNVADSTVQKVAVRVAADLRKTATNLPDNHASRVVTMIKGRDSMLPIEAWSGRLRDALATTNGFRNWQEEEKSRVAQAPWQAKKQQKEQSSNNVSDYIAHVQARQQMPEHEYPEIFLCRLIVELETVLQEKQLVRDLVAAIGDGEVTCVGELIASFPSAGGACRIASFAAGRPDVRRRRPSGDHPAAAVPRSPATIIAEY